MQTFENVFHGTQFSPPPHFTLQLTCQSLFISILVGYTYFLFSSKHFQIWNRMYSKLNNWLAGFLFWEWKYLWNFLTEPLEKAARPCLAWMLNVWVVKSTTRRREEKITLKYMEFCINIYKIMMEAMYVNPYF